MSSISSSADSSFSTSGETSSPIEPERGSSKTNHLVLMLGNAVIHAFSTSTFALNYLREHVLNPEPSRIIECASSTDTHTCQKRTFAKNFSESSVCQLYREMPNVTKLEVMCASMELTEERIEESVLFSITCLISHWAKSLVTVKMLFQYEPDSFVVLLDTLNRLSQLRHLTLEIDQRAERREVGDEEGKEASSQQKEPAKEGNQESTVKEEDEVKYDLANMPVLAKLEEFFYRAPVISPQLIDSLKKHGEAEGSSLARIGLGNERGISGEEMMMLVKKLGGNLAVRFVHMPAIQRPFSADKLTTFASVFSGITSLDIDSAELSLVTLANCLAPLTGLLYLRLTNAFTHLEKTISADDQVPPEKVRQLSSVRGLTLELFAKSHTVLKSAHWGHIFPGLLEAKVTNHRTNCSLCDGGSRTSFTKPSAEAKIACTRRLMEPLKQCAQLQATFPVDITEPASVDTTPAAPKDAPAPSTVMQKQ